jgi:hypothetical protein
MDDRRLEWVAERLADDSDRAFHLHAVGDPPLARWPPSTSASGEEDNMRVLVCGGRTYSDRFGNGDGRATRQTRATYGRARTE